MKIPIYRRKPEIIKAIPRLLARINPDSPHYQRMKDELYRREAGYAGEVKVDRILESINIPEPVKILADVELSLNVNSYIQIDTLILSPTSIHIMEIKNLAGTLTYIPNPPHFIQKYKDKESVVIDCPLMQLHNNRTGLDMWLEENGFPIRSTGTIVMANNKTSILNAPLDMPIMYAKDLPLYFRTKKLEKQILTTNQMYTLIEKLRLEQHRYNPYPLCVKNKIDPIYIKKGVICQRCFINLSRKTERTWFCPSCKQLAEQPYLEGLQDWFMLINPKISNEQCRQFLSLKDKHAANYILNQLPLKREGDSRKTSYLWDYTISPADIVKRKRGTSKS